MGLVGLSLAAAFTLPFEVFLFSYAVLGPLHYLTQISWMHERRYFLGAGARPAWIVLGALAALVTVNQLWFPSLAGFNPQLAFVAFGAAVVFVAVRDPFRRLGGVLLLAPLAIALSSWEYFGLAFSVLLPTLIHVCVFTACFVLVGALKSRDATGIGLLAVYVAAAGACFWIVPDTQAYTVSESARAQYPQSFQGLNIAYSHMFLEQPFSRLEQVFSSAGGLMIARFIAFSYTYHYLNWFSKTSVIKWHEVPRSQLVACVVLWLAAVGTYAWDYRLGLTMLGFLSLLHVYLEFPLNHATFATIGKETAALVRGRRPTAG